MVLMDVERQQKLLKYAPVDEVWGVGRKINMRLREDYQIETAWQLAQADPKQLRRHFGVTLERTARELSGIPCLPFDDDAGKKQMIACTRSFGQRISSLANLAQVVSTYATNVSEKLRRQQSLVVCLQVFVQTSPFADPNNRYRRAVSVELPYPTSDTRIIANAAQEGLQMIYRTGYEYAKAGVILTQIIDTEGRTDDLFTPSDTSASSSLMQTIDSINSKMGRGSVRFARVNPEPGWGMKRQYLSPAYMSDWNQLLKVHCR